MHTRRLRGLIGILGLVVIASSMFGYSYFEHVYFCTVEQKSISVSIQAGDTNCFEYIHEISQHLENVEKDIQQAERYIETDRDAAYRRAVVKDLEKKETERDSLRAQLIIAVEDYEMNLFLRVKGVTSFYLKDTREELVEKLAQAEGLLAQITLQGDSEQYAFVLTKMDQLHEQLALLDRIKFAQSFAELIPPLKQYLRYPRITKEDDIT